MDKRIILNLDNNDCFYDETRKEENFDLQDLIISDAKTTTKLYGWIHK